MGEEQDSINVKIKQIIISKGIEFTEISKETGIEYQRLNRMFNQNATMSASELLALCKFLKVDPKDFLNAA